MPCCHCAFAVEFSNGLPTFAVQKLNRRVVPCLYFELVPWLSMLRKGLSDGLGLPFAERRPMP